MIYKKINWNGFLKDCVKAYPNECVGGLFAERPYTEKEVWHVYPCKNISKKPIKHFKCDDKEWRKIRKTARNLSWNFIGLIHTHPYPSDIEFDEGLLQRLLIPSKRDITNGTVRDFLANGIIVCDDKSILGIRFHNPFGITEVPIHLISFEKEAKNMLPKISKEVVADVEC